MRRKWWLGGAAAGLAVLALVVPSRLAAFAEDQAVVKLDGFWQLVVDSASQHVFVSTGTDAGLRVTNLAGGAAKTITGLPDARGMALDPDGRTLYVALHDASTIAAIDTTTLKETRRFALPARQCPTWVTPAGGKLYFGYGCTYGKGLLGSLDVTEPAPAPSLNLGGLFTYPPLVRSNAAQPNLLVVADRTSVNTPFSSKVVSYDVASGAPSKIAALPAEACEGLHDAALTPDAGKVVLACSFTGTKTAGAVAHPAYSTSDMSAAGLYPSASWAVVAAVSPGGSHVIVGGGTSIFVERPDGSLVRRHDLPSGANLVRNGLVVGEDNKTLYAVTRTTGATGNTLTVMTDYARSAAGLTATAPATSVRGAQLTITGKLTGQPGALQVSRKDQSGTYALPDVTTNDAGAFTITDTPTVGGANTYTVSSARTAEQDGATRTVTVQVSRAATTLGLTTSATTYQYGQRATVTAKLGTTFNARTVCIHAQPYGQARTTVKCGSGSLAITYAVTRRTAFSASFAGDHRYAPATVSKVTFGAAKVTAKLSGHASTSGAYRVYRRTVKPAVATTVVLPNAGACAYVTVQKKSGSTWKTVTTSTCRKLSAAGKVTYSFTGTRTVGAAYRTQVKFAGTTTNAAAYSTWQYFKFKK